MGQELRSSRLRRRVATDEIAYGWCGRSFSNQSRRVSLFDLGLSFGMHPPEIEIQSWSWRRDALLVTIACDMPTLGTNSAAQVAKPVAPRPDHEFLFFSLLSQFTSCGGDLGSPHLDNVVR